MRDRIQELRRVKASTLRANPRNWRTHPVEQHDALRAILSEIGYADALLARPLEDGSLELIDGHLRAEITPDTEVPVLVLDLTDEEAALLLAAHDPLTGMAGSDPARAGDLLGSVRTDSIALRRMFDKAARKARKGSDSLKRREVDLDIERAWQLVVECRDEWHLEEMFERLSGEGLKCRVLMV